MFYSLFFISIFYFFDKVRNVVMFVKFVMLFIISLLSILYLAVGTCAQIRMLLIIAKTNEKSMDDSQKTMDDSQCCNR